jgi:hypothetical protein
MDVTKPYEFIGFGAIDVTKPYEFIGFGAVDVTKPYECIGFGCRTVTNETQQNTNKNKHQGRVADLRLQCRP